MEYIADNSGSYSENGSWFWSTWGGYAAHSRYHVPCLGAAATWTINIPEALWDIQATWAPHHNRSSAVTYQLLSESKTILREAVVNQKLAPVGTIVGNRPFQSLFNYPINSSVSVKILSAENGYVDADAIRFVSIDQ